MKLHTKFAFLVCCAATISLLSSRADTIQVQVGAGGAKFTPQSVTINVGDTVEWTWAGNNHSTTSGTPGNPDGLWDSGVHVSDLSLAASSLRQERSITSARRMASVAA